MANAIAPSHPVTLTHLTDSTTLADFPGVILG
jgi:hypothetical protein